MPATNASTELGESSAAGASTPKVESTRAPSAVTAYATKLASKARSMRAPVSTTRGVTGQTPGWDGLAALWTAAPGADRATLAFLCEAYREDRDGLLEAGAPFLAKPFTQDELSAKVRVMLEPER